MDGVYSNGPVVQHQPWDAAEIPAVAARHGQAIRQGDGSDFQIAAAHAQTRSTQLLKLGLAGLIKGHNGK